MFAFRQATGWRRERRIAPDNLATASTTSFAYVLSGRPMARTKSRLSISTEGRATGKPREFGTRSKGSGRARRSHSPQPRVAGVPSRKLLQVGAAGDRSDARDCGPRCMRMCPIAFVPGARLQGSCQALGWPRVGESRAASQSRHGTARHGRQCCCRCSSVLRARACTHFRGCTLFRQAGLRTDNVLVVHEMPALESSGNPAVPGVMESRSSERGLWQR